MNRIKSLNGYTIYQAGQRDIKKYGFTAGDFYVYFSSDVRDFGIVNSTPEYEGCGSLKEAEANCSGNCSRASTARTAQAAQLCWRRGSPSKCGVNGLLPIFAVPSTKSGYRKPSPRAA